MLLNKEADRILLHSFPPINQSNNIYHRHIGTWVINRLFFLVMKANRVLSAIE